MPTRFLLSVIGAAAEKFSGSPALCWQSLGARRFRSQADGIRVKVT
jgi:hypothetical protein